MTSTPNFLSTIQPKMRDGTMYDTAQAVQKALGYVNGNSPTKSCLNCIHFIEHTETCKKYNARPPARVIAFSCPEYSDNDDIPF